MSSFTNLSYHIIFSTKFRKPVITPSIRSSLYDYMGGIIRGQKGSLIEIGGIADHVHILAHLSPTIAVSDTIRDIKAYASKWLNEQPNSPGKFEWQKGYAAFTVSYSQIESVRAYIQRQEEHHRSETFRDEYIKFLRRHGIEFDPERLFQGEYLG